MGLSPSKAINSCSWYILVDKWTFPMLRKVFYFCDFCYDDKCFLKHFSKWDWLAYSWKKDNLFFFDHKMHTGKYTTVLKTCEYTVLISLCVLSQYEWEILLLSLFHSQLFWALSSCFQVERSCGRGREGPVKPFSPQFKYMLSTTKCYLEERGLDREDIWGRR